jgi:hypothetical protein
LNACEADAEDMAAIAMSRSFKVSSLLTKAATRTQVSAKIKNAAKTLKSGDVFMLTSRGESR